MREAERSLWLEDKDKVVKQNAKELEVLVDLPQEWLEATEAS